MEWKRQMPDASTYSILSSPGSFKSLPASLHSQQQSVMSKLSWSRRRGSSKPPSIRSFMPQPSDFPNRTGIEISLTPQARRSETTLPLPASVESSAANPVRSWFKRKLSRHKDDNDVTSGTGSGDASLGHKELFLPIPPYSYVNKLRSSRSTPPTDTGNSTFLMAPTGHRSPASPTLSLSRTPSPTTPIPLPSPRTVPGRSLPGRSPASSISRSSSPAGSLSPDRPMPIPSTVEVHWTKFEVNSQPAHLRRDQMPCPQTPSDTEGSSGDSSDGFPSEPKTPCLSPTSLASPNKPLPQPPKRESEYPRSTVLETFSFNQKTSVAPQSPSLLTIPTGLDFPLPPDRDKRGTFGAASRNERRESFTRQMWETRV